MTEPSIAGALDRAEMLCDLRRFDEAESRARQAVAADPANARALCVLSRACLGRDAYVEALEAAQRAIAVAPEDDWGYRLASLALTSLDRDAEARIAALEGVRFAPFAWQSHARLAAAAVGCSNTTEARQAASRAVELAPNEPEAWHAVAAAAAAAKRWDDAVAALRRALALDPTDSIAHEMLASIDLRRNALAPRRLAAAVGNYAHALRLDPRSHETRRYLEAAVARFVGILFVCAWVDIYLFARADEKSASEFARWAPVAILLVPALFAGRFIVALAPATRRILVKSLVRGWLLVTFVGTIVCCLSMVVAAVVPQNSRVYCLLVGVLGGVVARLAMWRGDKRLNPNRKHSDEWRFFRTVGLWVIAVVASLLAIFGFAGLFDDGGVQAALVFVAAGAVAALTLWWLRRRHVVGVRDSAG